MGHHFTRVAATTRSSVQVAPLLNKDLDSTHTTNVGLLYDDNVCWRNLGEVIATDRRPRYVGPDPLYI